MSVRVRRRKKKDIKDVPNDAINGSIPFNYNNLLFHYIHRTAIVIVMEPSAANKPFDLSTIQTGIWLDELVGKCFRLNRENTIVPQLASNAFAMHSIRQIMNVWQSKKNESCI